MINLAIAPYVGCNHHLTAILAAAQYAAADSVRVDQTGPSRRGAIASATAAVLANYYPSAVAELMREVERDIASERKAGVSAAQTQSGAAIGKKFAEEVMAWARTDGSDLQWKGSMPTGPGMWRTAPGAQPFGVGMLMRKPWLLTSLDQFRLAPPPAFNSPEFTAALDEVRTIARNRTPEQTAIARKWSESGGAFWVDTTTEFLLQHRVADDDVLRVSTLMAIGVYDLNAACWDTKYHYWLLRPTQADTTVTLAEGLTLPNFPAYPSGHACFAGFASTVIGHFVPSLREQVTRMAEENAMSRLYAGVHYRFDNDAGLEMGRKVARYVIEMEETGQLRNRFRVR